MADTISIIALVLVIIVIIAMIAIIIFYFVDRSAIVGSNWSLIQGSGTVTSFTPSSYVAFNVANGVSTVTLNKPGTIETGMPFIVNNLNNGTGVTVAGSTGITVTGANLGGTSSGMYIWSSSSAVQRIM